MSVITIFSIAFGLTILIVWIFETNIQTKEYIKSGERWIEAWYVRGNKRKLLMKRRIEK